MGSTIRGDHPTSAKQKMNTEKESLFRILSHREGSVQPMFDAGPVGPLSPSSSLLVAPRPRADKLAHLLFALEAERARGYGAGKLFVDCMKLPWPTYS
jgi:hypothetical protein